jgi:YfiH family protein
MSSGGRLERRILDQGVAAVVSSRAEADGFLVAFTERSGGVSRGDFSSLNLGLETGDDAHRVAQNRQRVCAALGIDTFATAKQPHGATVRQVGPRRTGAGFADPAHSVPDADGLVTSSRNVPLAVLVADCVPLALVEPGRGAFAVVHAGWRGVAAGIIPAALARFGDPAEVRATIGPAIGPDHYEVGEDVALAVTAASPAGARTRRANSRVRLDLPGTVTLILKDLGVRSIEWAEECTACQKDRFYSYRRDGRTGRQALIARRL